MGHNDAAQALDLLIHSNTINQFNSNRKSSKRVKFHPEVKLSKEKEVTRSKDVDSSPEITDNTSKVDSVLNLAVNSDGSFNSIRKYDKSKVIEGISYYEPYV